MIKKSKKNKILSGKGLEVGEFQITEKERKGVISALRNNNTNWEEEFDMIWNFSFPKEKGFLGKGKSEIKYDAKNVVVKSFFTAQLKEIRKRTKGVKIIPKDDYNYRDLLKVKEDILQIIDSKIKLQSNIPKECI